MSILNLLHPESGPLIAIPSQYDGPNALRLSEDVISISDSGSTVLHLDKYQVSTIENLCISEFQSLYRLIPDSISWSSILFDKNDIETIKTPESWVIDYLTGAFMMLLYQGNAFVVDTSPFQCCARLFGSNQYRITKYFWIIVFKEALTQYCPN